ncbi:hypothetical protein LXL04_036376 [Taraxacum kok-saghyz]
MGLDNECILNIQSLAGEYFCPVCRTLVYPHEALQTQCTHLYCKPCLTYVASSTQACPYDGYLVTESGSKPLMESNKALAETIGKTSVHCLYHRSGCVWQGPLSECTSHCSGCAFGNSPVVCNRCGIQIVHRQVQEHAQTCTVNGGANANSQPQGSESAQDTAAVDQSKIGNQAAPPASQPQPVAAVNQTPPTNPLPQVPPSTGVQPPPDQWYQQQYYQQYPGYDPFQQQQQQQTYQQYYPYQQRPPSQSQSQPQIQLPVQPQPPIQPQGPPQFQMSQVPSSVPPPQPVYPQVSQNQGQVYPIQSHNQPQMPPQSYPQVNHPPPQPQPQPQVAQYQQQPHPQMQPPPHPHFQPPPQPPPQSQPMNPQHPSYSSQPHQHAPPPMQVHPPPPTQFPQPPPPHLRPSQPPPHMLLPPSQALPTVHPHSQPGLPAHPRPIVHQVQQPTPQQYVQPPQTFSGQPHHGGSFAQGRPQGPPPPLQQQQPSLGFGQPHGMPPPQSYMGRPPMSGQLQSQQFPQPQSSGAPGNIPPHARPPPPQYGPNPSQPSVNMTNQPPPPSHGQQLNQYAPMVDRKGEQEDKKSESVSNEFRPNFNQVKPETGISNEPKTEDDHHKKDENDNNNNNNTVSEMVSGDSGTSIQRVKEEMKDEDVGVAMKQGDSEVDNGSSIQHDRTPPSGQPPPSHLRPPGPHPADHFHPPGSGPNGFSNYNRGYEYDSHPRLNRMSQGDPLGPPPPPPPHGPYGPPPFGLDEKFPIPNRLHGPHHFGTEDSPNHSSRPFGGYGMDGPPPPSRFLDKDPHGYYSRPPPFDDHNRGRFDDHRHNNPDFLEPMHGFGRHRIGNPSRSFGERFGPPPGPFGLRNRAHMGEPGFNSFQDYNGPHKPHLGEPGYRSSYSHKGFPGDGGFYPDSLDGSRKRKTYSMGWCRICKIDCDSVEGLDMHGQTREHQRMAMDMVMTIKQKNAKKHKGSNDHSTREEATKLRNTERVNAS